MRTLSYLSSFLLLSLAACGGDSGGTDGGNHDLGGGGMDLGTDTGAPDLGSPDLGTPDTGVGDTGTDDMGGGDGGPMNQCTNSADLAIIMSMDVADVAQSCALSHGLGMEPGTHDCIVTMTGLTGGCAQCYDDTVQCGVMHCAGVCIAGGAPCDMCLADNGCISAFYACSGLPMDTDAGAAP